VKLYDIRTMREMESYRGHNSDICSLAWHPAHESVLASGGYNGSLIYWLAGTNQAAHTVIADAHRQSIDVIAWHPAGHMLSTASHDGILKFWSREPPGSKCENEESEFQVILSYVYTQ
jgi:polyadenylation factor subunit 2